MQKKTLFNNRMRRIFSTLIILMLVISSLPMTALAAPADGYRDEIAVAVANFQVVNGDRAANVAEMERMILEMVEQEDKVDLILFPEQCVLGYNATGSGATSMHVSNSEPVPGPTSRKFEALAKKHGVYIVYGDVEKIPNADAEKLSNVTQGDDGYITNAVYNVAVVVGPDGLEGTYRKLHPVEPTNWCRAGENTIGLFMTPWGPIGISICYDIYTTPELSRYYAASGARLILNPTASSRGYTANGNQRSVWEWYYKGRLEALADREGVFVASANIVGRDITTTFPGGSTIAGPSDESGEALKYYGDHDRASASWFEHGWDIATLDLSLATRSVFDTDNWRPDLYYKWYSPMPDGNGNAAAVPADAPALNSAVVNFKTTWGDKAANLASIKGYIAEAAARNVNLLVFPEMALTGYSYQEPAAGEPVMQRALAETIPGPATDEIKALAQANNMHIVFGMPELKDGKVYNSVAAIAPDGTVQSYRKMFLTGDEDIWAARGDTPTFFDTAWGPMGLTISDDLYEIPELTRFYQKRVAEDGGGVRVILNSAASNRGFEEGWWEWFYKNRLDTLADRDTKLIVSANLCGEDGNETFPGGSCVMSASNAAPNYRGTQASGSGFEAQLNKTEGLIVADSISRSSITFAFSVTGYRPRIFATYYENLVNGVPTAFMSSGLILTGTPRILKAGGDVTLNAAFTGPRSSNTAILNYTFDTDVFSFESFTGSAGTTLLHSEETGDGVRIVVMTGNGTYDLQELGDLKLYVKDGVDLSDADITVGLLVDYAFREENGDKVISGAKTGFTFKVYDGPALVGDTNSDGIVDLLDLSNMIDWFGADSSDPDWDTWYIYFDFNYSNEIDVFDIAFVAKLI